MKVKVLASGSRGNSTYIEIKEKKILIDIGISFSKLKGLLKDTIDIKDIDYLLITHSHKDHIGGLDVFLRNSNVTLLVPSEVYEDIKNNISNNKYIILEDKNKIDDIEIDLIHLSHDVSCFGYIIDNRLVYITDTGYINKKHLKLIQNKEMYIFESNHDEVMLMEGPYPYILKQRVLSDKGHLSNSYAGSILDSIIGDKTKIIVLAHISQNNNTYDLAFSTVKNIIGDKSKNINLLVAYQDEPLDIIEV